MKSDQATATTAPEHDEAGREARKRRSRTQGGRSVWASLASRVAGAVAAATILPLAVTGFLAFRLAAYSFESSARGQVKDAAMGALAMIEERYERVSRGEETLERAIAELRRMFSGSLAEFRTAAFGLSPLLDLLGEIGADPEHFTVSALDWELLYEGRTAGRVESGTYVINDPDLVAAMERALASMPLERQYQLADGPLQLRLRYDLSAAALRIRSSGYVFVLAPEGSPEDEASGSRIHEVLHPSLAMSEVGDILNEHGESVARRIVETAHTTHEGDGLSTFEYSWANPGEGRPRDKIAVITRFEPMNWVVAAALYRDEYYRPLDMVRFVTFAAVLLFGSLASALAYRGSIRYFVNRVRTVLGGIRAVEAGRYSASLPQDWDDELGDVARAVNAMSATIGDRERRLEDLRFFQSNLLDALPSPILVIGVRGTIEAWNEAAIQAFALDADTLRGKSLAQAQPGLAELAADIELARARRERVSFVRREFDLPARRAFSIVIEPLGPAGQTETALSFFDLSEIDRLERQLRRSQKLETVGTLAAGLAHDLNNVLGGIVGTASVLGLSAEDPDPPGREEIKESVQAILRSSRHAADVVRQLLVLSRRQEMTLAPVDLASIAESTVRLCRRTFDPAVELVYRKPSGPRWTMGEAVQIEQAILNLLVNARDAMTIMRAENERRGGFVTISVEALPRAADSEPGDGERDFWELAIEDEGVGISPEALERIFDPFFTTKSAGRGSGLGLTMVYGIAERHGGSVRVDSSPGLGTTIRLRLPALPAGAAPSEPSLAAPRSRAPRGQGLVLVSEDDPVMLESLSRMLEACGYSCEAENRGEAALRRVELDPDSFVAAVLDLAMPGMSGLDLAIALRAVRPDLPILLVSGYDEDERIDRARTMPALRFLRKPFGLDALGAALVGLIGGEPKLDRA